MREKQTVSPNLKTALPPSEDPLGDALRLLQFTGVLYCNAELSDPWGIELPHLDGVMNVEIVTSGYCWFELEGESPIFMPEGSLVLVPRGLPHYLRGNPGDKTTPLEGIPITRIGDRYEHMIHGGGGRKTRITYCGVRYDKVLAQRLVRLLPNKLHIRTQAHVDNENDDDWLRNTVLFIAKEAACPLPGSDTVITRLTDILIIQAIRVWIDSVKHANSGWIAALYDRQIGKALTLMHRHPEMQWQVASLASEVGMSRSGFSKRFTDLVGEPALQYLTNHRMQLAQREIKNSNESIARIAERFGYESETAFSRAFKRQVGVPPTQVRK